MIICAIVFLTGCSYKQGDAYVPSGNDVQSGLYAENILTAEIRTEYEASTIAEKCGITLEKWENGHALFYTEEDLDIVIQRAEAQDVFVLRKNEKIDYYG